ncbi:MAG: GNAT family N-acetyltransferase, partial [Myxococcota bacterium]
MKIIIVETNSIFLPSIVALGRRFSATLGHFPAGAFEDAARAKTILAALIDDKLAGYLLYREVPTHRRASIVHLCVDPMYRTLGIGRALVE